jgi:hypothetical protein
MYVAADLERMTGGLYRRAGAGRRFKQAPVLRARRFALMR